MRKGIYLYAVATHLHTGKWYPWSTTFSLNRDGSADLYERRYGDLKEEANFKIKRFRVTT